MRTHTHLCTYVCTAYMLTYSLYIDVCMHVYADIPMGTKSSLNYPSGGVSSPETQSPHGWRAVSAAPPAAKALPELRQSPGVPRSPRCRRRRERDPKRSTAAPGTILAGCSHRHRCVRDTPTHNHHMARVPPGREGRESKPFPRFSLFVIGKDFKRKVLRAS